MVKVLKKGKVPRDVFRGDCKNCKSELEAERAEVKGITWDQREHGELGTVACPTCGQVTWVYPIDQN